VPDACHARWGTPRDRPRGGVNEVVGVANVVANRQFTRVSVITASLLAPLASIRWMVSAFPETQ